MPTTATVPVLVAGMAVVVTLLSFLPELALGPLADALH